jgi:hypothetical protein
MDGTQRMWSDDAAPGPRARQRPVSPRAIVAAGLGALVAAALFLGVFHGGLPPTPAQAEVAPAALAGGDGAAQPSIPRLCFDGSGGELLDFASRQHCR